MELDEMTLDELWKLFPITFIDYNDDFPYIYKQEEKILKSLLDSYIKRISHIGSTAIKNIKTKPIIDILIEIDFGYMDTVKDLLLKSDYILMSESKSKLSFNKGYTKNGYADKVYHIHIKKVGDCDELYFRDYLNDNYSQAKKYEKLKIELYEKYQPNRDLYTEGKSEFIKEIVNLAKQKYKNRY